MGVLRTCEALGLPVFFSSCSMLYVYVFDSEDFCLKVADGNERGKVMLMRFESF